MSDEKSYWLIDGGKAAELMDAYNAENARQRALIQAFCLKHGGTGEVLRSGGFVTGIRLEAAPDASLWVENKDWSGFYRPRGNKKEAKPIAQEMRAFKLSDSWDFTQSFFGVPFVHTDARHVTGAYNEIVGEVNVIIAPDSDELKPVDGLRRIKASEYWAMREAADAVAA